MSDRTELLYLFLFVQNDILLKFSIKQQLTTIREGVSSRARVPRTGVAGALPLLQAFS